MKVLFVQKVKALFGSEKFLLETIPRMEQRGIQCEMLVVYQEKDWEGVKPIIERTKDRNITVHYIKTQSDLSIGLLRQIHGLIKKGAYDLIHSNLIHADIWLALIKTFFNSKLKVVSTKHNYDEKYTNTHGFKPDNLSWKDRYYFLSRLAEKKMNYAIAISNGLYELYLHGNISPAGHLRFIPYGFDLPSFEPTPTSPLRKGPQQLVIVGRMVGFKGHRFVVKILPQLLEEFPQLNLIIVGIGEEEENLKQQAAELGVLQQIIFTGYQTNVLEWMNQSDLVLIPSVSEGFGIVILEAFNSRTPVVAFDVPAPNEIIEHDKTGILIPPFDLDILKSEIVVLLKDAEKRERLGDAAYRKLKSYYTLDRMVDEILEVYAEVLTG